MLASQVLRRCRPLSSSFISASRTLATVNPPRLFDYQLIKQNLKPSSQINDAIEKAFGMLAKDKVDVPIPMHIGIHESAVAGPGDCHIKGKLINRNQLN